MIALLIGASSVFYACKKDTFNNDKSSDIPQAMMAFGSYSQPTQNIDIQTYFNDAAYLVTGNAVVGSYNGQIYECNLGWKIFINAETGYEMAFEAVLKPGYDGTAVGLTNGMSNYDITINGQEIGADGFYHETVDGVDIVITPNDMVALWGRVVDFCADNVTIIVPHTCSVIMTDAERAYLIAFGHSMAIDDFKLHARDIITSGFGQIFVTTVKNGNVHFMGMSATGNQASWYNRLYEHFINHHPINDTDDTHLVSCIVITVGNEEEEKAFDEWYAKALEIGLPITTTIGYDEDGNMWIKGCNGLCMC